MNSKLLLSTFALIALGFSGYAQATFSSTTTLLNNMSGNSYEDCVVDMNGDFLDDVVRVKSNGIWIDYQNANGTFTQMNQSYNWQNLPSWSICAGDIDNNGYNDLLFGGGSRVSFLYANSNGTSYTEDYHNEYIFSQRSTMADINNDGHLDAFVCHDVDQSHPYRNDGSGNLSLDIALLPTADLPGNYAAQWTDYDNDRDNDLYITKCRLGSSPGDIERTNLLYRNNGDGTYTEVGAAANMNDNDQSWATAFEDFDNDGDMDAFTVNHYAANRFMENNGNGTFTDIIGTTDIAVNDLGAWECAAADFDNDGYVDILSELSKELYMNDGDMTFTGYDLSFNDGAIGDLNNDGLLDVVKNNTVWLNTTDNDNNWVKINTIGVVSNKSGIGARVEIHGTWGMQIREVRSGESFSPMNSLTTHFGLGAATTIDSIKIWWPSGEVTVTENPAINTTHNVAESSLVSAARPEVEDINLYPNPTTGEFRLHCSKIDKSAQVQVVNATGAIVAEYNLAGRSDVSIDLSDQETGIYIVRVLTGNEMLTRRVNLTR